MIYLIIQNERIVGYQTFDVPNTTPYDKEWDNKYLNGKYGLVNGEIVELGFTKECLEENEQLHKDELRNKRKPLLEAFDLWEKAVLRGRENDSQEVMDWYRSLLDLDEIAFENIPKEIKYYL